VQTSDVKGAGTDSNVSLILHGTREGKALKLPQTSGGFSLDNSHDNFERGKLDTFVLTKQLRLQEITRVVVGHDGWGLMDSWHLKWIEVHVAGGGEYFFSCDKWVDKGSKELGGKAEVRSIPP
jgi:lipoxygenase homology domain-containing protein 1